jgi:hypothetical protein
MDQKDPLPLPYVVIRAIPYRMAYAGRHVLARGFAALISGDTCTYAKNEMVKTYILLTKIACVSMYRTGMRFLEFKRMYHMENRPYNKWNIGIGHEFGVEEFANICIISSDSDHGTIHALKDVVVGIKCECGPEDLQMLLRSNATVRIDSYNGKTVTSHEKDAEMSETEWPYNWAFDEKIVQRDFTEGSLSTIPLLVMLSKLNHRLFPPMDERTNQPSAYMKIVADGVDGMLTDTTRCVESTESAKSS